MGKKTDKRMIAIAGATGVAGSSILRRLLDEYPEVKIRAGYHMIGPHILDERIEYVRADLRLEDDARKLAKGADIAIMAAALSGGAAFSSQNPFSYVKDNLLINLRLLEAFEAEKIKRIIFIGSATVYQEFEGSINEDELDLNKDPAAAYFGFGWQSRYIEKLCAFINKKSGIETILVRASNIFGPYAKFDPLNSNFIPALIRKAVSKMEPFEVWGDPGVVRDVIYSEDFADAVLRLAFYEEAKFNIYNIGSSSVTSVADVVEWALKYARHSPKKINYLADKPTTIRSRMLDCSRIRHDTGWRPAHSAEEGIRLTTEWWIKNKERWSR